MLGGVVVVGGGGWWRKLGRKGQTQKGLGPNTFFPPCRVEGVGWDLFERHTIATFHFTSFGIWPTRIQVMSPFGR